MSTENDNDVSKTESHDNSGCGRVLLFSFMCLWIFFAALFILPGLGYVERGTNLTEVLIGVGMIFILILVYYLQKKYFSSDDSMSHVKNDESAPPSTGTKAASIGCVLLPFGIIAAIGFTLFVMGSGYNEDGVEEVSLVGGIGAWTAVFAIFLGILSAWAVSKQHIDSDLKSDDSSEPSTGTDSDISNQAAENMIFTCPHCGNALNIPKKYAGTSGTCNNCSKKITLPELRNM